MLTLLSDRALKDFAENSKAASDCLRKLAAKVGSLESLLSQNKEITKLKYFTPSAWRYRHSYKSDWYRVVFTTAESRYLIVHRILPKPKIDYRRDLPQHLYEGYQGHEALFDLDSETNLERSLDSKFIPDQEYSHRSRYYHLPQTLVDAASPEELADYILTGSYWFRPKLTGEQEKLSYDLAAQSSRFIQIQGAAGTGKSTLAFHLADNAVSQGFYPVILVPNAALQKFGTAVVDGLDKDYQISLGLKTDQPSHLSILTSENFFQNLSATHQKLLSHPEGNRRILRALKECKISLPESLKNVNFYAVQQSLLESDNQYKTKKDGLIAGQEKVVKLLSNLQNCHIFRGEYDGCFSTLYEYRDSVYQARQILKNFQSPNQDFSELIKLEKPVALIVDEVQDYYWLQLSIIYSFFKKQDGNSLLILLGDENQRVTISGFTWPALTNSFQDKYQFSLPKPFELTRNFRNTKAIARVAEFFLLDGFQKSNISSGGRHPVRPPDSEACFETGSPPRLIEFDDQWFAQFTQQLKLQVEGNSETKNCLVFITHEASRHYHEFKTEFGADSNQVIILNVREVKGQEFDAVVLVSPFLLKKDKLSLDDLFDWYTSITRARRYETILVSSEEMQWLKKNLKQPDQLETLLSVSSKPNCQSFVDELLREGTSFLSKAERQKLFIRQKMDSIWNWLKTSQNPPHIVDGCQQYNLDWWNLCEEVEYHASQQSVAFEQQCRIQVDDLLTEISLQDLVILYFAVRQLLPTAGDSESVAAQIVQKLEDWFHTNPQEAVLALRQIENYELKALILRATGQSWQAAELLTENGATDSIEEVARDLERRGLSYDAARLRVHYLNRKWPRSYLKIKVSDQTEPLVTALCNHFVEVLEALE